MVSLMPVELLKILASETLLGILGLLLKEQRVLRFTDNARALDIYPSSLEDHLKRLVENNLVVHAEGISLANVNTEVVQWVVNFVSRVQGNAFFA
jgi:Mn-dependent DtxR family transcriptional regulator